MQKTQESSGFTYQCVCVCVCACACVQHLCVCEYVCVHERERMIKQERVYVHIKHSKRSSCSVFQCVAACCSALQCFAVGWCANESTEKENSEMFGQNNVFYREFEDACHVSGTCERQKGEKQSSGGIGERKL